MSTTISTIVLGPPGSAEFERGLQYLQQMCENLGVLLAEDKTKGPATRLTVLGIEFDSQAMVLRLPADKLQRPQSLLAEWHTRCSGELESLVGIMQHASKVVRHGCCFLCGLYHFLAQTQKFKKHYKVRLNSECQADLEWWVSFSRHWNGVRLSSDQPGRAARTCTSGRMRRAHGVVALSGRACGFKWRGISFPPASHRRNFLPIVVAGAIWGRQWKGAMVCAHCDNAAVVDSGRAKDPLLAHQLRTLFYVCAYFDFEITAVHTPGKENGPADAISRNNLHAFFSQAPTAA